MAIISGTSTQTWTTTVRYIVHYIGVRAVDTAIERKRW